MRYPARLLTAGEEIIDAFRPHWTALAPALLWAMLLAALAGIALAALGSPWRWVALAVAVAAWLALSLRSLVDWLSRGYVLTTERIIIRRGLIARTAVEIALENITNVHLTQSMRQRILRFGDVTLETVGANGRTTLEAIPDPEGFQSEVYAARELRARSRHTRSGVSVRALIAELDELAARRERGELSDEEFAARREALLRAADGE